MVSDGRGLHALQRLASHRSAHIQRHHDSERRPASLSSTGSTSRPAIGFAVLRDREGVGLHTSGRADPVTFTIRVVDPSGSKLLSRTRQQLLDSEPARAGFAPESQQEQPARPPMSAPRPEIPADTAHLGTAPPREGLRVEPAVVDRDAQVGEVVGDPRTDTRGLEVTERPSGVLVEAHAVVEQVDVLHGDGVALHPVISVTCVMRREPSFIRVWCTISWIAAATCSRMARIGEIDPAMSTIVSIRARRRVASSSARWRSSRRGRCSSPGACPGPHHHGPRRRRSGRAACAASCGRGRGS
jgi:hypothetical protein